MYSPTPRRRRNYFHWAIRGQFLVAVFAYFAVCATSTVVAQSEQTVVATVNGRSVTLDEVDATIFASIFALKQQIHAQRKVALENFILRLLLEDEARSRGISVEALKRLLTEGKVEVSYREVEREYSQNASAFGAMSPDEAKERIRLSIESQERIKLYQAALNELRKKAHIDVRFSEPKFPMPSESVDDPTIGPKNAAVTIVEFTDFQCPFCRDSQTVIKKILETYNQDVRLIFKHLPLDIHERAFEAAKAGYCAAQQQSFWQYHDALFDSKDLSNELLIMIASRLRLDVSKFKDCISSETSRLAVLKDVREAKQFGINATPTFIINGKLVQGSIAFDEFKSIIENELKLARPDFRPNLNTRKD